MILAELGAPARAEQLAAHFGDLPPGSDLSGLESAGPGIYAFQAQIGPDAYDVK